MDAFIRRTPIPGTGTTSRRQSSCLGDQSRPPKKRRFSGDSESDRESRHSPEKDGSNIDSPHSPPLSVSGSIDGDDCGRGPGLESALADVEFVDDALDTVLEPVTAGEAEKGSGDHCVSKSEDLGSRNTRWVRGRSSVYVDAFRLALDIVLEDESHLFDEREQRVFQEWRSLDYESQYLYAYLWSFFLHLFSSALFSLQTLTALRRYVRLFLRKTASWHRISRLGYHSDIADVDNAVLNLERPRFLPLSTSASKHEESSGLELEDICIGEHFSFVDRSEAHITSAEDAAGLLSFEEMKMMAKELKLQGKTKSDLSRALCRNSKQQTGLFTLGIRRTGLTRSPASDLQRCESDSSQAPDEIRDGETLFVEKVSTITGPCIRIAPMTFKLFERVHLVFYRSTEWTEKSLTTIILAKISRRNFASYLVGRSSNIFTSRVHMMEFESALRLQAEVDKILEQGDPPKEEGFKKVISYFEGIYPYWETLLAEEQVKEDTVYDFGEGAYLRRFTPAHTLTRIVHKAAHCFGRLKNYKREYDLLVALLAQRLFHPARRGDWYQRKALLEEHYMYAVETVPMMADEEQRKKHWRRKAIETCEHALQDSDCHLIYHYDLQKRLTKLERRLRIPRRLQHDFKHVRLDAALEHVVEGIQIKRDDVPISKGKGPSTKTVWVDEYEDGAECSVEEMCLSWYRSQGWKGYHSEGGIVRTLFALLFFDIIFLYVPNVFQTAYQSCPLDLHTDSFYPTRASEINRRLAEISNGDAESILREVYEREHERKTCVVGLNWDFALDDLAELVSCFKGDTLAAICKVMTQEYRQRGGGLPDLVLWRKEPEKACMFVEVKSANDRLSDTQRLWIHVLMSSGVDVALCHARAKEVRTV